MPSQFEFVLYLIHSLKTFFTSIALSDNYFEFPKADTDESKKIRIAIDGFYTNLPVPDEHTNSFSSEFSSVLADKNSFTRDILSKKSKRVIQE